MEIREGDWHKKDAKGNRKNFLKRKMGGGGWHPPKKQKQRKTEAIKFKEKKVKVDGNVRKLASDKLANSEKRE